MKWAKMLHSGMSVMVYTSSDDRPPRAELRPENEHVEPRVMLMFGDDAVVILPVAHAKELRNVLGDVLIDSAVAR